jgi:hypothetical protein
MFAASLSLFYSARKRRKQSRRRCRSSCAGKNEEEEKIKLHIGRRAAAHRRPKGNNSSSQHYIHSPDSSKMAALFFSRTPALLYKYIRRAKEVLMAAVSAFLIDHLSIVFPMSSTPTPAPSPAPPSSNISGALFYYVLCRAPISLNETCVTSLSTWERCSFFISMTDDIINLISYLFCPCVCVS